MDFIKQAMNSLIRYLSLRDKHRRIKHFCVILTGLTVEISSSVYAHNVGQALTSPWITLIKT